ncbi:MAG TPA: IS1595 family transposase [Acidimicrobiales bacterium]|nr:IS1595 family transposase [Acidimicrobiales bacterium]
MAGLDPQFGNSTARKTAVVALIEAETDEVRAKVVTTVSGPNIRRVIRENVELAKSVLHTDSSGSYSAIGREMAAHHVVNHHIGQYVTALSDGTNKAENFFSQLKRSISGTHHSVSPEHLHRYVAEFAFRHGSHDMSDTQRMNRLILNIPGQRLVFRDNAL